MKLKDSFISQMINDSFVLISAEKDTFNGIVNGNETAGFIVECLKTETTTKEIVEKLFEVYEAPKEILQEDTEKVIKALKDIDALED